jgi:hypothetical protein
VGQRRASVGLTQPTNLREGELLPGSTAAQDGKTQKTKRLSGSFALPNRGEAVAGLDDGGSEMVVIRGPGGLSRDTRSWAGRGPSFAPQN